MYLKKCLIIFIGAFVPLTAHGKIIVDGVLVSCYADINHDMAHLTMIPIQSFPIAIEWIFGEDIGYSIYVSTWRKLGMMFLPNENVWSYEFK